MVEQIAFVWRAAAVLPSTLLWRASARDTLATAAGSLAIETVQPLLGIGANDAVHLSPTLGAQPSAPGRRSNSALLSIR